MITPPDTLDGLVQSYLHAVDQALGNMSADRRRELLSDLSDHIAAERAALDPPTEAGLRAILDRLGDPATVATEARLLDDSPPAPMHPMSTGPMSTGRSRLGPLAWIAIVLGSMVLIVLGVIVVGAIGFSTVGGPSGPAATSSPPPPQPTHQ